MNRNTKQQRAKAWHHAAGLVVAIVLAAGSNAQAETREDARKAAAKEWYASQNSGNRSSAGRVTRRPTEEARQQVRLSSQQPAGNRAQHALAPVDQDTSWCQPPSSTCSVVQLSEELRAVQTVLDVGNPGSAYCGASALPARDLTAVGLLGFSGAARLRPRSQDQS
jgi:hypothetical protein